MKKKQSTASPCEIAFAQGIHALTTEGRGALVVELLEEEAEVVRGGYITPIDAQIAADEQSSMNQTITGLYVGAGAGQNF